MPARPQVALKQLEQQQHDCLRAQDEQAARLERIESLLGALTAAVAESEAARAKTRVQRTKSVGRGGVAVFKGVVAGEVRPGTDGTEGGEGGVASGGKKGERRRSVAAADRAMADDEGNDSAKESGGGAKEATRSPSTGDSKGDWRYAEEKKSSKARLIA